MALSAGTRLGPFEIVSAIGAGGMGEVYKARDTRLDRTVAIKILPQTLAADPEFRDRFDREAQTISQLDHPHICALYDVGEQDGLSFLVMQYLEGETLAERLRKGAMRLEQTLVTAVDIAQALDAAHRAGIVHRDLKPGNIIMTRGGAKLVDFGLAKARPPAVMDASLSMMPTTPAQLTAQGTILGTVQYMAPEQLEGKEADARTDIFAFGTIVYEMLTGRKAFEAQTPASLVAAIIEREPTPLTTLQPLVPSSLDRIVRKCLAKEPERRWQSANDLADELKWVADTSTMPVASSSSAERSARRSSVVGALIGLVVGVLATLTAARFLWKNTAPLPAAVVRTAVGVAPADQLRSTPADDNAGEGRPSHTAIALSPDGHQLVFSGARGGRQQLFIRPLDQLEATPIPGTEDGLGAFFSPDGKWLGFWASGALKKVPLSAGPPTTVCETPVLFGASWTANDDIIFARQFGGLLQVPARGGVPRAITELDSKAGEVSHRLPFALLDGKAVLYTVTHHLLPRWDEDPRLAVLTLGTGERRDLGRGADARHSPTGHLVFMQAGTLAAVPFDSAHLNVTGGPVSVIGNVMQAANMVTAGLDTGAGQFGISQSGTLVYVPGGIYPDRERTLVQVNRQGTAHPLDIPPRAYQGPRASPDGRQVLFWTQGVDRHVWLYNVARQTTTRLTSDGRNSRSIWTPDGTRVTFASASTGADNLFWKAADGSGAAERLTTSPNVQMPSSWSPDGKTLAFVELTPEGSGDIWALSLDGDRRLRPVMQTRFDENYPEFSPDGRWIAYVSNESGRNEVYVQPFPGPGAKRQMSNGYGSQPAWSRDGHELFYTDYVPGSSQPESTIFSVPVTLAPTFTAGTPRQLFRGSYLGQSTTRGYDMTIDGGEFLTVMEKKRPPLKVTQVILVEHWFEELKARVPAK